MNAFDRRRVVVASVLHAGRAPRSVGAQPRLRGLVSGAPNAAAAGVDVAASATTPQPSTTAYQPAAAAVRRRRRRPPALPGLINVAVPPAPGANELLDEGQLPPLLSAPVGQPCTTLLAPDGATLTVTNLDNGQTTTCTNTLGHRRAGRRRHRAQHGAVHVTIGDLADAPVPVRVSW